MYSRSKSHLCLPLIVNIKAIVKARFVSICFGERPVFPRNLQGWIEVYTEGNRNAILSVCTLHDQKKPKKKEKVESQEDKKRLEIEESDEEIINSPQDEEEEQNTTTNERTVPEADDPTSELIN